MAKKKKSVTVSCSDFFDAIRQKLHTSAIPDQLPCRDREFTEIYEFLKAKISSRVGGCMYISGVPGTGKTATVYEVIKALRSEAEEEKKSKKRRRSNATNTDFKYIEVNGLRLTDPYQVYCEIYKYLQETSAHISTKAAAQFLETYFSDPDDDQFVVLMIDELDLLCTRKQTILYHLFDWPNKPNSNLVVVAIANAMDLSERILKNRVASRLGLTRLTFQPYTHQQLNEIISSRLDGIAGFDLTASQLVARKVAAVSGDARRALDICRLATNIAESRCTSEGDSCKNLSVKIEDVGAAVDKLLSSTRLVAIRMSTEQEKIFLRSIVQEFRSSGLEEADFVQVARAHRDICKFERTVCCPSPAELFEIAFHLYERRLVLIDDNNCFLQSKIRLNVSSDDIDLALKSDV